MVAGLAGVSLGLSIGAFSEQPRSRTIQSSSRQFTVEAPDARVATSIARYSERLKSAFLAKMQLPDRWQSAVHIRIQQRKEGDLSPALVVIPQSFKGQLQFVVRAQTPPPLDQTEFFRALTQILCAEQVNRAHGVQAGEKLAVAPLWLAEGLWQSLADNAVQVPLRDTNLLLLQRAVGAERAATVAQLTAVTQLPAESAPARLFGAQSQALVESLLSLPDGARKMQALLASLRAQPDARAALQEIYKQDFRDEPVLEKWWALRLRARAQQRIAQALTASQTVRRLDETLPTPITVTDRKTGAQTTRQLKVSELGDYWQMEGLTDLIQQKIASLATLQTQAHPTFREPIAAYVDALENLKQRGFKRYRKVAKIAEQLHQEAEQQTRDVAAYLNEIEEPNAGLALSLRGFFAPLPESGVGTPQTISTFLDKIEQAESAGKK